ncbi:hypothetical protein WG66_015137, partial [Moniliophthora roreri]
MSESHLSFQEMNLMKKSLSSGVNLLPRLLGTTFVGGVGERDGGSGIRISMLGGGSLELYIGASTVRLFMVLRLPLLIC